MKWRKAIERTLDASLGWRVYALVAGALIAFGTGVAIARNDPALLSWVGAIVAALGAVLIIVQIRFEIRLNAELIRKIGRFDTGSPDQLSPAMAELVHAISERSKASMVREMETGRLSAVVVVACIAALGEFIHGWGDVIVDLIDRVIRPVVSG